MLGLKSQLFHKQQRIVSGQGDVLGHLRWVVKVDSQELLGLLLLQRTVLDGSYVEGHKERLLFEKDWANQCAGLLVEEQLILKAFDLLRTFVGANTGEVE